MLESGMDGEHKEGSRIYQASKALESKDHLSVNQEEGVAVQGRVKCDPQSISQRQLVVWLN